MTFKPGVNDEDRTRTFSFTARCADHYTTDTILIVLHLTTGFSPAAFGQKAFSLSLMTRLLLGTTLFASPPPSWNRSPTALGVTRLITTILKYTQSAPSPSVTISTRGLSYTLVSLECILIWRSQGESNPPFLG